MYLMTWGIVCLLKLEGESVSVYQVCAGYIKV